MSIPCLKQTPKGKDRLSSIMAFMGEMSLLWRVFLPGLGITSNGSRHQSTSSQYFMEGLDFEHCSSGKDIVCFQYVPMCPCCGFQNVSKIFVYVYLETGGKMIQFDFDQHMFLIGWIARNPISTLLKSTLLKPWKSKSTINSMLFLKRPLDFSTGLFHQQVQGTMINYFGF